MKKLMIFIGVLTAVLAAIAVLLPVEVTEGGNLIIFGKKFYKKSGKRGPDRVICTDSLIGVLSDRFRMKRERYRQSGENYNCEECKDCMRCESCVDCEDCSDCVGCEGCTDCMDCVDCMDCENCNDCFDCVNCVDCDNCVGCSGLIGVSGARNRSSIKV